MRRLAALALALWAALAGAAAAQRPFLQDLVEEVRAFSARIAVQPDGSVEVTEEFEVTARGVQIRRGIYRDILLRFRDRLGLFPPEFRLIEATRDGAPETARVVAGEGSLRVYLGREEVLLPPGVHRYRLRYRLADQVDLYADRAELAWNVNGTSWTLPIRGLSAVVVPPPGAAVLRHEIATGRAGERGQDATVTPKGDGLLVQAARPLARGESVTLFVSFPREAVTPTLRLEVLGMLEGQPLVLGGAGLMLALGYFLLVWLRVGRDPRPGPIVPVYQPTRSPAWMRFLRRRGFDEDCVVAALLSLAVKGCVVISDGPGEGFTIERRTPPPGAPAPSADEAALLASLCDGGRDRLEVPTARSPVVERVVARYRRLFDEAALRRHVRLNQGWWAGGVALLAVWGLGMAALAPEELLFSMVGGLGAGLLSSDIRNWPGGDTRNWPTPSCGFVGVFERRAGLLQKAGAALFAQAVAVAADGDDVAVVQQPVEDRGGDHRIAEDGAPLADRPVRGDQHGTPLVAARHQLEEQVSGVGLKRQVAEFVHDQQPGLGEVGEPLLKPPLGVRLGEAGDQRHGAGEQHRIARHDRLAAERNRQMCLAHARGAEQQQRVAVGNETPGGQITDLGAVERGLGREVEAGEIAHEGELRQAEAHLDAPLVLARDLPRAEERQGLPQAHLLAGGLVEQRVELVADRRQLQPRQHLAQRIGERRRHHQPPPTRASYSASGRSRAAPAMVGGSASTTIRRTTAPSAPATPSKWARSTIRA